VVERAEAAIGVAARLPGDGDLVVVGQVPHDGVRAGVQTGRGELLAQLDDKVQHLRGGRVGVGPRPPRAGLKDRLPSRW